MHKVNKGDTFTWEDVVIVQVTRVAEDGTWADVACRRVGDPDCVCCTWTKRQLLPFPESFIPVNKKNPVE